jgi:hypothetical protein
MACSTRVLVHGTKAVELPEPIELTVRTRCPGKWVFVDLETGDSWVTPDGSFIRPSPDDMTGLSVVVFNYLAAVLAVRASRDCDETDAKTS